MFAIQVIDLVRDYRSAETGRYTKASVRALDHISLEVDYGTSIGILGPNGAGKTTLVKILTTVITPTSGSAHVVGYDVVSQPSRVRPRIGVSYGGDLGLYWRLNGLENLVFAAQLQGMTTRCAVSRARQMLKTFGLEDAAYRRVNAYSRGMRQRLHLARALLHSPDVVFLDEPTSGLDPAASRDIRSIIHDLRHTGKTVFLTTHNLSEAEELCDIVVVLARGRILALGTSQEIKRSLGPSKSVEIRIRGTLPPDMLAGLRAYGIRNSTPRLTHAGTEETNLTATYDDTLPWREIVRALGDVKIADMSVREITLEEAYLRLLEGKSYDT
jgi:ABC-2 type transport system ATP-binding protein